MGFIDEFKSDMFLTVFKVFLTERLDLGLLVGIKLLNGLLTVYKAAFN